LGQQSSLMLFRFVAVDAETPQDAHSMIEWSEKTNISLETVGRAGDYFDPKTRRIDVKKARWMKFDRRTFGTISIVFMLLILPVFVSLITSRAILQFKVSKQWFLLGQDSARTLFVRGSEEFNRSQCVTPKLGDVAKTGFTESDAASLCKFWQDPQTNTYIQRTVHQQRFASGSLLFVLGLFSFRSWRGAGKARAAQKVHERLGALPSSEQAAPV
jgi:hypothetical protein